MEVSCSVASEAEGYRILACILKEVIVNTRQKTYFYAAFETSLTPPRL